MRVFVVLSLACVAWASTTKTWTNCKDQCNGKPCWCISKCPDPSTPLPPLTSNGQTISFNGGTFDTHELEYCFKFEALNNAPPFTFSSEEEQTCTTQMAPLMGADIANYRDYTCVPLRTGGPTSVARQMFDATMKQPIKLTRTEQFNGNWLSFKAMAVVVQQKGQLNNNTAQLYVPSLSVFAGSCVLGLTFDPVPTITVADQTILVKTEWLKGQQGLATLGNKDLLYRMENWNQFMSSCMVYVIAFSGVSLVVFLFVQRREEDIRHAGKLEVSLAVVECLLGVYLLIFLDEFDAMGSCGITNEGDKAQRYPAILFHFVLMLSYGYQFGLYNSLFDQLREPLAPAMPGSTKMRRWGMACCFLAATIVMAIGEGQGMKYTFEFDRYVKWAITGGLFISVVLIYSIRFIYHGLALGFSFGSLLILEIVVENSLFSNALGEETYFDFGLTPLGLCWVRQTQNGLNTPMWLSFYVPVCVSAAYGFCSLLMGFMLFSHHDKSGEGSGGLVEIENQAQYTFTLQKSEHVARVGILVAQQLIFVIIVMAIFYIDSEADDQVFCNESLGDYFGMVLVLYSAASMIRSFSVLHRSVRKIPWNLRAEMNALMCCTRKACDEMENLRGPYHPVHGATLDKDLRRFLFLQFVEEVKLTIEDEEAEDYSLRSDSDFTVEELCKKVEDTSGTAFQLCYVCLLWLLGKQTQVGTSATRGWRYNRSADFRQLRQHWNIQEHYKATFIKLSKMSDQASEKLYKEGQDHGGKSGSFMFRLHHSEQYIVKAIPSGEAEMFLQNSVFDKYKRRMLGEDGSDGNSFIVKVLGVYRTNVSILQEPVYFQVLEKLGHGLHPELVFDLKGSGNRGNDGSDGKDGVRKDQMLREMLTAAPDSGEERIEFHLDDDFDEFKRTLEGDVKMLQDAKLIDYSLLIFAVPREEDGMRDLRKQVRHIRQTLDEQLDTQHENLFYRGLPEPIQEKLQSTVDEVTEGLKSIDDQITQLTMERVSKIGRLRYTVDDPAADFKRTQTSDRQGAYTFLNGYCEDFLSNQILELQKLMKVASKLDGVTDIERALTLYISSLQLLEEWINRKALAFQHEAKCAEKSPRHHRTRKSRADSLAWGKQGEQIIGRCTYTSTDDDGSETERQYNVACAIIDIASNWGPDKQLNEIGKSLLGPKGGGGAAGWLHPNDWGISAKPAAIYAARFQDAMFRYLSPEYNTETELPEITKCCCKPIFPKMYQLERRQPVFVMNPNRNDETPHFEMQAAETEEQRPSGSQGLSGFEEAVTDNNTSTNTFTVDV